MKVTNEMVDRAARMLANFAYPTGKRAVRNALEAALADVPDDDAPPSGWRHNYEQAEEECTQERERANRAEALFAKALDAAELLWGVVANASGGEWKEQSEEWRGAAVRARDSYHATLDAQRVANTPFEELLARSSFGTPEVKAICSQTPPEVAEKILQRVKALEAQRVPVWVEELAQEWEKRARHASEGTNAAFGSPQIAKTFEIAVRAMAAELRERSREGR